VAGCPVLIVLKRSLGMGLALFASTAEAVPGVLNTHTQMYEKITND
jgi:hypothetical protein